MLTYKEANCHTLTALFFRDVANIETETEIGKGRVTTEECKWFNQQVECSVAGLKV